MDGSRIVHLIADGCKRAGIDLSPLYRKANLHPSYHFKWMHGKARPTARSVAKMSAGMLHSAAVLVATALRLRREAKGEEVTYDIRDDLFGMCAMIAYAELATAHGGPPPSEWVQKRAYQLYEQENAREKQQQGEEANG